MAIRPDSDPRSAPQRQGAPKGELEQYGVWVKAEPQDIVEEAQASRIGDLDFEPPADSAFVPEESFLSEDEEKLLGSFDADFEGENTESSAQTLDLSPLPDIEDMPELDESLLAPGASAGTEGAAEPAMDISLEDSGSREASPIHPGASIDFDALEGLELEEPPKATATAKSGAKSAPQAKPAAMEMEDVSSDFLDLPSDSSAPPSRETPKPIASSARSASPTQGLGSGLDDVTAEFLDIDESASAAQSPESVTDFETLDIDLHFDDTLPQPPSSSATPSSPSESEYEEVTEFDDFLSSGPSSPQHEEEVAVLEEANAEVPEAQDAPLEPFDDLAAVEKDLGSVQEEVARASPPPRAEEAPRGTSARQDLSTEILLKIADELANIRGELVSLKSALGEIKREPEPEPQASPIPEESIAPPVGGFFDEEEDETIALTGDELDNILNTADFTEESVEPGEPTLLDSDSLDLVSPEPPTDTSILDEELLPETGVYAAALEPLPEPAIEEIHIGRKAGDAGVEHFHEASESPEAKLELQGEAGVLPITDAPEDTSYLESESIENLETPAISDVPLVEPDLSEFDLESEELGLEPRPEIEEELPLVDASVDLPLDMPLPEAIEEIEEVDELEAEAEYLEPIAEIEDVAPDFNDINLHDESLALDGSVPSTEASEVEDLLPAEDLIAEVPTTPKEDIETTEEIVLGDEFATEPTMTPQVPSPAEKPKGPAERPEYLKAHPPKSSPASSAPPEDGDRLKSEIRSVLSYLDKLLDSLPEEKIEEFARSEYFDTYKRLFEELGLV